MLRLFALVGVLGAGLFTPDGDFYILILAALSIACLDTAAVICGDGWDRNYSRERAAFPVPHTRGFKFWPAVGRLNHVQGDRNLVCSCPPIEEYAA